MKFILEFLLAVGLFFILKNILIFTIEIAFLLAVAFFVVVTWSRYKIDKH